MNANDFPTEQAIRVATGMLRRGTPYDVVRRTIEMAIKGPVPPGMVDLVMSGATLMARWT